jgi:PST family polysaccharide transporter
MLGYSMHIMMVNGLGTFIADVDYLIIGRVLGQTALGLYTLAFRIPELIIRNLAQAVSNVAFPVAARLQADRAAMREAYLTMQHYMLVILAPLGFGLYAITPTLMRILFEPEWWAAIPVMEVLCIYMVVGAIGHWPGVIYKAVGRPDILNKLGMLKLAILVPALWWAAVNYNILGVAWAQLIVRIIGMLIDMYVVSRFVGISIPSNLRIIWPPFGAAIVMAAAVRAFLVMDTGGKSIPALVAAIALGALVYTGAIWLLDRQAVTALWALARGMLRRERAAPVGVRD